MATVTTPEQVQSAQQQANVSLTSQTNLLNALQNQNAPTAQSQMLNSQQNLLSALQAAPGSKTANQNAAVSAQNSAMGQQGNLNTSLAAANGVGAQQQALSQQGALNNALSGGVGVQNSAISGLQGVAGQQAGLAQQYQNIASGQGPNPAMAQLNQTTGQNVANQAALMAGQRGAGANVGLMARQAAQQGAATQQQAVGQGATMEAQQRLNALSGLSSQQQAQAQTQQAIGGLGTTQAGMQQSGIGQQANIGAGLTQQQQAGVSQQAAQAQAQIAQQQAQQAAAAQQANTMAANQIGVTQQASQNALGNAAQQQAALGNMNTAQTSSQNSVNAANTGLAQTNMQGNQAMIGGLLNAAGGGGSMLGGKAHGGYIMKAEGGEMSDQASDYMPQPEAPPNPAIQTTPAPQPIAAAPTPAPQTGPASSFGQFLQNVAKPMESDTPGQESANSKQMGYGSQALEKGVSSAASMGTKMFTGMLSQGGLAKGGGNVNAHKTSQKANRSGDSEANDKIPSMLSEGEIVIPRSVAMSKDPVRSSADFVAKVIAQRRAKGR